MADDPTSSDNHPKSHATILHSTILHSTIHSPLSSISAPSFLCCLLGTASLVGFLRNHGGIQARQLGPTGDWLDPLT